MRLASSPSHRLREAKDEYRVAEGEVELEVPARGDDDELLAVHREYAGSRVDAGAAEELPQHRPGLGVVRLEPAVALAGQDEAAGGRRGAAHHRLVGLHLPDLLAGGEVDSRDVAPLGFAGDGYERAAQPQPAALPRRVVGLVVHRLVQALRVRVTEGRVDGDR